MRRRPLSRRAVLRGAGGIAIGLPFLQAMTAQGQTPPPAKRLLLVFSPLGTILPRWTPRMGAAGLDLTGSECLAPLEPYKANLCVVGGLDIACTRGGPGDPAHGKGIAGLWTGVPMTTQNGLDYGGGPSLDQKVALAIGGASRVRSIQIQAGNDFGPAETNRMIFSGANSPITPNRSPSSVFDTLFTGVTGGGGGGTLSALNAQRKSVLDFVAADFTRLNAKLEPEDKVRLDKHLAAIRDIERRISAPTSTDAACDPALVRPDGSLNFTANAAYPTVIQLMTDLFVMALACDVTRVGSFQWSRAGSRIVHNWLPGISRDHHDISHGSVANVTSADANQMVAIHRWYSQRFAYLLEKLSQTAEAGVPLLDSTLVVWGNELSEGASHLETNIPFVIAGKATGGHFRMNRFAQYGDVPHNNLLAAVQNALGIPGAFGTPGLCTTPLNEILA